MSRLSLDLPDDLLETTGSLLGDTSRNTLDPSEGCNNNNGSKTKQDGTEEEILDESTNVGVQLDLPSGQSSTQMSLSIDQEENMSVDEDKNVQVEPQSHSPNNIGNKEEDTDVQPSQKQDPPSESMTIPDDTQSVNINVEKVNQLKPITLATAEQPSTQSIYADGNNNINNNNNNNNNNVLDNLNRNSTPIADRRGSFHILDDDEEGTESCSTSRIVIPLEFVTPNKSQSTDDFSEKSLDESSTQECVFAVGQSTPERTKLAEILAKQAEEIVDMRNLGNNGDDDAESNFDKEFSITHSKVSEVTFTIGGNDNEHSMPRRKRARRRLKKIEYESDKTNVDDDNDFNNNDYNDYNDDDIDSMFKEEPLKKQRPRKLRRIASLLEEEEENNNNDINDDNDNEDDDKEVYNNDESKTTKDRYSLKNILETLDFDTYKNSLFEYDDALSDKDSEAPLDADSFTGTESDDEPEEEAEIVPNKHKRAHNKLEKKGSSSGNVGPSKEGEGGDEPAVKRVKRGGLPFFRGLHFFLTRIPREAREAIKDVLPNDSVISTPEAAFEYITCCNKSKRFKDPKTFLVATQPIRTAKYILALALGVPCVSQEWVTRSVEEEGLCDYRDFLLPRGFSVVEKTLVPAKRTLEEVCPLDGYRIELLVQVSINTKESVL